ncbi:Mov34/MPN/PAD-1 family protein [Leptolyngbya ohadii]|uniref:Mov34/MPN/PAD-1 family protein n=1 Tax=Leptolyngbya ohadii TaxID=1962290 RepID=UPI000B5A1512|nr:M67 family metallopeptidase [Leptolyngbya ohadii]
MLYLTEAQLRQIQNHAERTYPEECCGLLLGQIKGEVDRSPNPSPHKQITEIWETHNAWTPETTADLALQIPAAQITEGAKLDRYWIDPKDLLKAQRYCRDRGWSVLGIYHSHPDHVALPSECDRLLAWAEYVYIIVSVHQGKTQDVRGWQLDENHQFQPVELLTTETDLPQHS